MSQENTFYAGICMAGAVSAGAYTAGVMDYLIEALEEWESRRGQPNTPSHRVVIPVLGGSSAGGMTGIVTAGAINNPITHVGELDPAGGLMQRIPGNKFYHSWVDLTQDDMFPLMLDTGDIEEQVYSLLNSKFIDEISERVVHVDKANWIERKFFDPNMKVFVTMTNLGGFSYDIAFQSNSAASNKYYLEKHNDYTCFILNKTGDRPEADGWIPLSFRDGVNTALARDAAMATGAFPLGLKSRTVTRPGEAINRNEWICNIPGQPFTDKATETTYNIDGGLINNEPFEMVRKALNKVTGEGRELPGGLGPDYKSYDHFRSTVLMVDPFPSEKKEYTPDLSLMGVAAATLGAMMGQLRTKPEYLISAMDSKDSGQYIIAPKRSFPSMVSTQGSKQGAKAIACGSLGGFGGFLDKRFRIHDFFLGRANCERFLRYHFTVPAGCQNPIFKEGYAGVADAAQFTNPWDKSIQIIPLFTKEKPAPYMPSFGASGDWPVIAEGDIDRLKGAVCRRTEKVIRTLVAKPKAMVWLATKLYLSGKATDFVLTKLKEGMREHQLMS
jgi:hypothetical protein